jgi:cytochrome c oxidase cbb3-type subunit 3
MSDHHTKDIDAATGIETTGHEWDGIKELTNPLPRWWLYIFYACIVWSIGYWILMPAWPALPGMGSNTPGIRSHSDRALVAEAIDKLHSDREATGQQLVSASLDDIMNDQSLLQFAMASGESVFGDRCATCHGSGGQGAPGYPALVDDDWLWGGEIDEVMHTIRYGIRQENPDSRYSMMTAFGRDQILSREEVTDVTHYVRTLSGLEEASAASAAGKEIYDMQCVGCHMEDGTGDTFQGAPNLTDGIWLYGSDFDTVYSSIFNPKNSAMPAWGEQYSDAQIKALAVYVHTLGGGS